MTSLTADSKTQTMRWLLPLVADLIGIGLFFLLNPFFSARFGRNALDMSALTDALVLVLPYILFLFGVHQVRRLAGKSAEFLHNRLLLGLIAVPFALALAVAIADLTGYLNSIFTVDFGDMGNGYYFLTTPAVYLFFALLYFFILIQTINQPVLLTQSLLVALIAINLFAVAVVSYLGETLRIDSGAAKWATLLLVSLFLFTLPRLIYQVKTHSRVALPSLCVFLLIITAFA